MLSAKWWLICLSLKVLNKLQYVLLLMLNHTALLEFYILLYQLMFRIRKLKQKTSMSQKFHKQQQKNYVSCYIILVVEYGHW